MAGGLPVSETGTLCITLPNNRLRQLPRQDAPETVLAAWPVVRQSTIRTETTSMTNAVWTNRRALHTSGSQVNSWLGRSAKNRRSTRPRPRGAVAPERGGAGPVNGATRACRAATRAGPSPPSQRRWHRGSAAQARSAERGPGRATRRRHHRRRCLQWSFSRASPLPPPPRVLWPPVATQAAPAMTHPA